MRLAWSLSIGIALIPAQASGQFSSDFPGVPRARVPYVNAQQGRFELDLVAIRAGGSASDTIAGMSRVGFGHSFRIASIFEFGYDVSVGEVRVVHQSAPASTGAPPTSTSSTSASTTFGYGARFGLKVQPFSIRDANGYGVSAAVGVSYQPPLESVFGYDTGAQPKTSGYIGEGLPAGIPDLIPASSGSLIGAVDYRSPRVEADLSLGYHRVFDDSEISYIPSYDGGAVAVGARYYLTSSFAIGGAYWGGGPPPWRDRVPIGIRSVYSSQAAVILTFGAGLEQGTDIIVSSPSNDFSESWSLYIRSR
jgi:hypothetical protein